MADLFVRYSGAPANDTGLDGQAVGNGAAASGQDYASDGTIQRRFNFQVVFGAGATDAMTFYFQPKVDTNYSADAHASHVVVVEALAGQTAYQEFVLPTETAPKNFRINARNDTGDSVTVTVEHEHAVLSDT